jgi:filamentous hemagglutinin family protein
MTTPRLFLCTFCTLVTSINAIQANPLGGTVVPGSGAAAISSAPGSLTINQSTPKVIINWQDFSIGAGEVTRFVQPSSSAAALNRVTTDNPSQIYGTLQGNGAIYLINPNGILVGQSGQINVGSFLGSTLDLGPDAASANASFLSGAGLRLSGDSTAAVRNEGRISALDDVFLVAHTVQNAGTISGHTVGLAAGADIELRQGGSERLSVVAGNTKAAPGATDGVINSGNIAAVSAELKAAGGNIYALAINNGGVVRATGIVNENGRILLRSDRGTVINSGTLDASSRGTGTKGGDVQVLGQKVGLAGNSKIDVSGDAGGGTVLVGGDLQGKNPNVPNAQRTVVGRNATISADALSSGSGGKVIVWSDEATKYLGSISARGAGHHGSGGFVEVSGKSSLAFDGAVDVAAARGGAKGTVLLDPATITIQAANPDINGADPGTSDITTLTDLDDASGDFPGADSIITATAVNGLLTGNNNLILAAGVRATVNAAVNGSDNASLTLNAPQVNLNAPITLAGSGVLSGTPTTVNVGSAGRIQNGIDVAAPVGATVNVAAGTYAENISVAKGLVLAGAKAGLDARSRNTASGESVISGQVRLEAPNITLDGFTVRDSAAGAGIVANNAAGDQIINNYITANVFGLSLASDGSSDILVRNNFFEDNTLAGGASGNGIYTDFTVSRVRVRDNRFEGHPEGSVTFLGTAASTISDIDIIGNRITGDGPISIGNISGVRINGNSVTANDGHAIWVGGGAVNVSITQNLLHDNAGAGLKFARPGSSGIAAVSSGFTVRENSFQNNADGALVIDTAEGSRYAGVLNASGNWWGNFRGPRVASAGFAGSGNDIAAIHITDLAMATERVDFSPWLNSGINTAPVGVPGFLGDLTVLNISPLSPKATADGFIAEALTAPFNLTQRLQLFGGTYADQTVIDIPNTVAVIVKEDVILNAATSVSFGSTVNSDGTARNLDIITPTLTLGGAVGTASANSELGRLTASGNTTINGGVIETAGVQTYSGPVTLGADTALFGMNVTLAAVTGAGNDLAVIDSGTTTFDGAVTGVDALSTDALGNTIVNQSINAGSVIFNDTAALNGGSIATTADQNYNATVTLGLDTILSGANVTLANVNGGGNDLRVNASGATTFGGVVAGVDSLTTDAAGNTVINQVVSAASITLNDIAALNGGLITTLFDQAYNRPVTLGADTTLVGVNVTLGSTVTGAGSDLTVNASAITTFGGAVAGVDALSTDAPGDTVINQTVNAGSLALNDTATLNGGTVTTSGSQTYNAAVTLGADTTLNNTTVAFGSTVDGAGNDLTLNSSGGITLNGPLIVNVDTFRTTAPGATTLNGGSLNANTIEIGDQLVLGADTLLTAANVTLAGISGAGRNLNVNASGATIFNGVISGVNALVTDAGGNTAINQAVNATSITLNDAAALNGATITTVADQNYNAAVTLGADTTLSGANVTLAGITGGNRALNVNASGASTFNGLVNGVGALTTDAAGNTVINQAVNAGSVTFNDTVSLNGGTITTAGNQNYNAAATLGADTTLSGANVRLVGVTGAGRDLTVNASGATTFDGVINGVDDLVTDAAGNTVINQAVNAGSLTLNDPVSLNGGAITTAGNQNYNAAATLGADTTLSGANVRLVGITGAGRDLTVNASGATTFDGPVTGVDALVTDASGNTVINQTVNAGSVTLNDPAALNGGTITTLGGQIYNAAVTLGADTVLNNTIVAFNSTVAGGGNDLTLNSSGDVTLNGPAIANVGAFRTTGPGSTILNGGGLSANTLIAIGDDLVLGDDTTLSSVDVSLGGVDGFGNSLTVDASGVTTFGGTVVGVSDLTTDLAGNTIINTPFIGTFGSQTYNDAVTLGTDATLGGANITFASTLFGGNNNLAVNSVGITRFGGDVSAVGSLVTDAGGSTIIDGTIDVGSLTLNDAAILNGGLVTTFGNQTYNNSVTLGSGTTLNANSVRVSSTLNGAGNDLDVTAAGAITFNGAVSQVGTLTLGAVGNIDANGPVRVNHLLFTSLGAATLINSGNEIVNAVSDCAFWSALDGFLVSDRLSAKVFRGVGAGSCISIDNDEAVEKIVSQLVPQVQFDEIQAESVEISGERLQKAGILTRSSELFLKPGEALTRSGEVIEGKTGN